MASAVDGWPGSSAPVLGVAEGRPNMASTGQSSVHTCSAGSARSHCLRHVMTVIVHLMTAAALVLLVTADQCRQPNEPIQGDAQAPNSTSDKSFKTIWQDVTPLNRSDIRRLRKEAWEMFDFGFSNYMTHAFPKDNLLPLSCSGENWQGGIAVTLIDSLDALLLMNRRADMEVALHKLRHAVSFDLDERVHVFETTIRVLGGLLSGHVLLSRDTSIVPEYDGLFLRLGTDLADRMMAAFKTPTGLPSLWVNLRKGAVGGSEKYTCTACAGTMLLEFGALSVLTGRPEYLQKARHAARVMYDHRSRLGLVGSSLDVASREWVHREATIGPGIDSYYEYLLKAYLMLGQREYLDMFVELYASTMRHLQLPGTFKGYSFMADVHMDSGKLTKPWVSSLGAFWPGMQAMVGQLRDAVDLHANFTAAWRTFGWLPELFGLDLSQVHPDEPGYNLRPEHIESTFLLHSLTGNPLYLKVGANIQRTLQHNRVRCGYARIGHVQTGAKQDLMESFFLSETVKYLYLLFSDAPQLVDHYVLSTEGHLLPPFPSSEVPPHVQQPPENCRAVCQEPTQAEEDAAIRHLRTTFPLLPFRREDAALLRQRRCVACSVVSTRMAATPTMANDARARMLSLPVELGGEDKAQSAVLAQVLCLLDPNGDVRQGCVRVRTINSHDITHGVPHNSLLLQLSRVPVGSAPRALLLPAAPPGSARIDWQVELAPATFGAAISTADAACVHALRHQGVSDTARGDGGGAAPGRRGRHGPAQCPVRVGWAWGDRPVQPSAKQTVDAYVAWLAGRGEPHACAGLPLLVAPLGLAQPEDGCSAPVNAHELKGRISLTRRGNCSFSLKVANMERAGASAVVVINNEDEMVAMADDPSEGRIPAIPIALAPREQGDALLALMRRTARDHPAVAAAVLLATDASDAAPTAATPSPAGAAGGTCGAGGSAGSGRDKAKDKDRKEGFNTRVDLLIPLASQAFLVRHVHSRGDDVNILFERIMNNKHATELLSAAAGILGVGDGARGAKGGGNR